MKKDKIFTIILIVAIAILLIISIFVGSDKVDSATANSVSNDAENGFIEYTWTGGTIYTTPAGNVKYNTIVVSDDITFTATETEIQFIRFTDNRIQVVNPGAEGTPGYLTKLKGIIVDAGNSIIIEKTNTIHCTDGAYLGAGATVYKGGGFTYPAGQETANYFSLTGATWSTDQIVVW